MKRPSKQTAFRYPTFIGSSYRQEFEPNDIDETLQWMRELEFHNDYFSIGIDTEMFPRPFIKNNNAWEDVPEQFQRRHPHHKLPIAHKWINKWVKERIEGHERLLDFAKQQRKQGKIK